MSQQYLEGLEGIRKARKLTLHQLAESAGLETERLQKLESEEKATPKELGQLSRALHVAAFELYTRELYVSEPKLIDYRSSEPHDLVFSGSVSRVIYPLLDLQVFLEHLLKNESLDDSSLPFCAEIDANPEQLASALSSAIGLTKQVRQRFETPFQYYKFLRGRIEKLGAFVVHRSAPDRNIKGAALFHSRGNANIIWINTNCQNAASRSVTLLHEFAHLLLRVSGVSHSYRLKNDVETFCNRLAINVLAPRDEFEELIQKHKEPVTLDLVRVFARHFNISQQAVAIRLEELEIAAVGFHDEWKSQFLPGEPYPDEEPDFARSRVYDGGKVKLAQYGVRLSRLIIQALHKGLTDEVEVFTYTRLKPKFFDSLDDAAVERLQELAQYD